MSIIEVIESKNFVILDTETTGLYDDDEIVSIAIIDSDGQTLLNQLVKPVRPIPADATRIHGITNEMVSAAHCLPIEQINALLAGREIIVYNASYDMAMLYRSVRALQAPTIQWRSVANWYCAMEHFAEIYGEWNDYRGNYKWQRLSTACAYYNIPVVGAHGALADCLMTLAVCQKMAEAVHETAPASLSEFALIGCAECGATGQPLIGGLCPQCLVKLSGDE